MRKCFIHIGTHKTGTTSIQQLLSSNSSSLQERGYSYPRAGCPEPLPGHHNLAWEVSRDRRFQKQHGTIDDLVAEVKSGALDIVLSSEDFESALHHADNFKSMISKLQDCDLEISIVLYVRSQIDYVPRIYSTLLCFGFSSPFRDVVRGVANSAELRWREWVFNFNYLDMLSRIHEIANIKVIVRSYDQARTSMCSDFLSILGLDLRDLNLESEILANTSLPLRNYLLLFLQNRMGRGLSEAEARALDTLVPAETSKIELAARTRLDLYRRFSDSNRRLFLQYGIPEPKLEEMSATQRHGSESLYLDDLFSESTETRLAQMTKR